MFTDYHTHTVFCDGENTPEEMIQAAIERGLAAIGFSGHSYTFFDESYCMTPAKTAAFRTEILRLKEAYSGRIRVLLGLEQDYEASLPEEPYDYLIGSVHYVKAGGAYIPVDDGEHLVLAGTKAYFDDDIYAFIEAYYAAVARVKTRTNCDIVGHFDLITKDNGDGHEFDKTHPRYVNAWRKAANRLLDEDAVFEINTAPLYRGFRKEPYPSLAILSYLGKRHARVVLSSDSHRTASLAFGFAEWREKAKALGLTVVDELI